MLDSIFSAPAPARVFDRLLARLRLRGAVSVLDIEPVPVVASLGFMLLIYGPAVVSRCPERRHWHQPLRVMTPIQYRRCTGPCW